MDLQRSWRSARSRHQRLPITRYSSASASRGTCRDPVTSNAPVDSLLMDVRHGFRMLTRNAGFTVAAVLALGLGIGVNDAVFTAYKRFVARPLDARDPDKMVNLALTRPLGATQFTFSYPDYEAYRDSSKSFTGLIGSMTDRLSVS